jgi:hypothetical protein
MNNVRQNFEYFGESNEKNQTIPEIIIVPEHDIKVNKKMSASNKNSYYNDEALHLFDKSYPFALQSPEKV